MFLELINKTANLLVQSRHYWAFYLRC